MVTAENPSEALLAQFGNPAAFAMYLAGLSADCDLAEMRHCGDLEVPLRVRLEVEDKNAEAFKAAKQLTDEPYARALVQSLIDCGGPAPIDACSLVGTYFISGLFTLEIGAPFLHQIVRRINPQDHNAQGLFDIVLEEYALTQTRAYGEVEGARRAKAALRAVGLLMQF